MKNSNILLIILVCFLSFSSVKGQILSVEGFEGSVDFPGDYPGWNNSLPPFSHVSQNACEGLSAIRINLFNQNLFSFVEYTSSTPAFGNNDVVVSFDYKVVDKATGNLASGNFGQIDLQYSINGGNWSVYDILTQPTSDCSFNTYILTSVPVGAIIAWKLSSSFNANYPDQNNGIYLYVDDFKMVEQVACIEPVNLSVDESSIDYDGAYISWEDINSPMSTQWEVGYCTTSGGDPSSGNPLCFPQDAQGNFTPITINGTLNTTLSGLDDGKKYYVYVRSVCGTNGHSNWAGPIIFQTIAVGTDCTNPIDVDTNNLPYTHISNTDIYGSDEYMGSPGNTCGGNSGLLNGYEVVYRYTSTTNDILSIDVTGLTGTNVGVFVYEECAKIGNVCLDGDITSSGNDLNVNSIYVNPGEDYYIVIASLSPLGQPQNTQYTLNIKGFDCPTWPVPHGNSTLQFVAGQKLSSFSGVPSYGIWPAIEGAVLNWYEDNNGTIGNLVTTPLENITLINGDKYWVTQSITLNGISCESSALLVTFDEFICATELTGITSKQDDSVCEAGQMTLTAYAASPNVYWYESATSKEVIEKGNTYITPVLYQSTSYWVSEVFAGVGLIEDQGHPGPTAITDLSTNDRGLGFSLSERITLVDVRTFVTETGNNVTLELLDINGNTVKGPVSIPINSGSTTMPQSNILTLNWTLDPGAYYLVKRNGPSMIYAPGNFPYPLGSAGQISGNYASSQNDNRYYYFFDWTIVGPGVLCESPRTEVTATVDVVVPTTVSSSNMEVCMGDSSSLYVQSVNPDYVYEWTWKDVTGVTQVATGATIAVAPMQNTTYTVTATDPITGCEYINEITIGVYGTNSIPISPKQAEICLGEIAELTAGGLKYDFEEANSGWTTENHSVSLIGNKASASWRLVDSPYLASGDITSNDASRFYISIADSLGAGGELNTQLISPSFNTVGLNSMEINFYHYLNFIETQKTEGAIEVSVNQGLWQTVKVYDGGTNGNIDLGTPTQFVFENVDLSQYVGASDLRVRFRYSGGWGWSWAIDNITFELGYINGSITWSPSNGLYLDAQASLPYNGEPTNTIYFYGNQTGTFNYTANLNIINCGSATENITVVVHDTPLPTGSTQQIFGSGDIVHDLEVTGQNLSWYIKNPNGDFVQVSVNTPLQHGMTYYVSQTMNGCESGLLGITVSFQCPAPMNIQVNTTNNGNNADAIVTWMPPADISGVQSYFVEIVETSSGDLVYDDLIPVGQDYAVIQGLDTKTNYTLNIYSVCDITIPVYSDLVSLGFETLKTTGFDFSGFSFYPNPTRDKVYFQNKFPIETISVYDLMGKRIIHEKAHDTDPSLDFSALSPGTYLVDLSVNGTTHIVKIIKK